MVYHRLSNCTVNQKCFESFVHRNSKHQNDSTNLRPYRKICLYGHFDSEVRKMTDRRDNELVEKAFSGGKQLQYMHSATAVFVDWTDRFRKRSLQQQELILSAFHFKINIIDPPHSNRAELTVSTQVQPTDTLRQVFCELCSSEYWVYDLNLTFSILFMRIGGASGTQRENGLRLNKVNI